MDELKIPCVLVSGTGTNSNGQTESHAWNYVQLDGKMVCNRCNLG